MNYSKLLLLIIYPFHNHLYSCNDIQNIHKKILKTISKINHNKNYKVEGFLLPDKKKNNYFGHGYFMYNRENKTIENHQNIQDIMESFKKFKDDTQEKMSLNISLGQGVKMESKPVSLITSENGKEVICEVKYSILPKIRKKYDIQKSPILFQLLSAPLDLKDLEYVVFQDKNSPNTAIIFFYKQMQSNKIVKIENFFMIILGDQYSKKYHIYNILGMVMAIDGRTIITRVNTIQ